MNIENSRKRSSNWCTLKMHKNCLKKHIKLIPNSADYSFFIGKFFIVFFNASNLIHSFGLYFIALVDHNCAQFFRSVHLMNFISFPSYVNQFPCIISKIFCYDVIWNWENVSLLAINYLKIVFIRPVNFSD